MGNCCSGCLGRNRKNFFRSRYTVDTEMGIEFQNLMDEEASATEINRTISDHEREVLKSGLYEQLVHEQKKIDAEIDAQLAKQEEELRLEEEAYAAAKREAARASKLQKQKMQEAKATKSQNGSKSWLGEDENEWDVAGGEDDFEMFLASVRARSLKTRAQNSGMQSVVNKPKRSMTEEELTRMTGAQDSEKTSPESAELEWENDFVSAEELENELLINEDSRTSLVDR
ncbi:AP-1 complex-associated regulatory protein [Lingula anatina]|uniref:AP-1 complex-associated regulatory protein n=1 Tax=Lingula anatina TaxID=7574 RepID=A0A2R2MLS4_LINAN|nr:AP-1 complex-associated regulatory protein [Lingula anatina]|eukprot:XP_023931166.1 AP-1 complex-associated regulatory protein [Lingula anatina]